MSIMIVALSLFAALGVVFMLLIIWFLFEERRDSQHTVSVQKPQDTADSAFTYLDNEVRGTTRLRYPFRGSPTVNEPTLKGRVDKIEEHLNISVEVKPSQPAKLIIKKRK